MPQCPFCLKHHSRKKSRGEHVIPRWMAKEFPNAVWTITNRLTGHSRPTHKYVHLTTHQPCGDCDSSWMSDIEKLAQPVLTPLIHGHQTTLNKTDQIRLGIWMFKTTMMFDLHCETHTPRKRFFDAAEFTTLKSDNAICNPYYQFFIAASGEPQSGFLQEDQLFVRLHESRNHPTNDLIPAYALTFCVEHLILQIFCVKGLSEPIGYNMRNFEAFSTPLIPNFTPSINWPPERVFSAPIVDEFIFRWSRHLGRVVP